MPGLQVEIGGIEVRPLLESLEVGDLDLLAAKCRESLVAQLAKHSIHMDRRESEGLRKIRLRDREAIARTLGKTHDLEAIKHLAEQMRDTHRTRPRTPLVRTLLHDELAGLGAGLDHEVCLPTPNDILKAHVVLAAGTVLALQLQLTDVLLADRLGFCDRVVAPGAAIAALHERGKLA